MKKIAITGAAGNIGGKLRKHLESRYELVLLDQDALSDDAIEEIDLSQWDEKLVQLCNGVDTIIHLAANPSATALWLELLKPNIDAMINVYEAASMAGVRRVVFASSNHAMGGYKDRCEPGTLTVELPPRPGAFFLVGGEECDSNAYGTSKLMGERIGRWYSIRHGLSVIALRIGWVRGGENRPDDVPEESEDWLKQMWLSNRDFCQLAECCIEADPNIRFEVVNAMSNNAGMPWDLEHTRKTVGYEPQDGRE